MRQSRLMSLVEAVTNVVVGLLVAVATQIVVFPILGVQASLAQNLKMARSISVPSESSGWSRRGGTATSLRALAGIRTKRTPRAEFGPGGSGLRSYGRVCALRRSPPRRIARRMRRRYESPRRLNPRSAPERALQTQLPQSSP